jgi:alpha-maltose-1-phosphate synthase
LKVLLLTREYPPDIYGGAGVHVEYLARELAKLAAVEVRTFGRHDGAAGSLVVRGFGNAAESADNSEGHAYAPVVRSLRVCLSLGAEPTDADVVHSHTWYAAFGGLLARLLHGVPLVVTAHSIEPLRPWKREQLGRGADVSAWVERAALEAADAVIAVSTEMGRDLLRHHAIAPERVHVIPNGVDTETYRPAPGRTRLQRFGLDPSRPYVLFVGRISRQKGLLHLIRAIPRLPAGTQIVLCAGSPDTPEIAREVETAVARVQAERSGIVWIPEMVDRATAVELYSHAAVFCCPSVYEPFGLINLEAMACEVPVVASAVGGIPEVVVDGETGRLVPVEVAEHDGAVEPRDPDCFAQALAHELSALLENPALRRTMGVKGRQRAEALFSWGAVARRTLALYRALVESRGRETTLRGEPTSVRESKASTEGALVARAAVSLRETLGSRRWFGGKNRNVSAVIPLDHAAPPGTTGVLALFEVVFADQGRERYCIPVAPPGTGQGPFADAMADPAFCLAMLEAIRSGATLAGERGTFRFAATPVLAEILPTAPREPRPIASEQSNTSVVYDRRAILKLLRRLESGASPELELTDFLTREAAFPDTPRLAGVVAYQVEDAEPVTLALLHEFVPNKGDAWTAALERLGEYYASAVEGRPEESPDPVLVRVLAAADAQEAARLGKLTGRLHRALASAPSAHALGPEPITAGDVASWVDAMLAQLDRAREALATATPSLPPALREAAQRVVAARARLGYALRGLDTLATGGVMKVRIHGDYHLGQLLRTADGFAILDFEGEPARSLAERRAKQCVLKDVAGMLRSFDYAAQVALGRRLEANPQDARLAERLRPWAETWEKGVRTAFLEAYLGEAARGGEPPLVPVERERFEWALYAYELEKALYELGYELANRPAWVVVPLLALDRAVAKLP